MVVQHKATPQPSRKKKHTKCIQSCSSNQWGKVKGNFFFNMPTSTREEDDHFWFFGHYSSGSMLVVYQCLGIMKSIRLCHYGQYYVIMISIRLCFMVGHFPPYTTNKTHSLVTSTICYHHKGTMRWYILKEYKGTWKTNVKLKKVQYLSKAA